MKTTTYLVSKETLNQKYEIDCSKHNVAIVFGPQGSFYNELSKELKKQCPSLKVLGLGTTQSFLNNKTLNNEMSVAVLSLEKTKIETFVSPNENYESSYETGKKLLANLVEKETKDYPLSGVLIFSEGLNINGAALVRAFDDLKIPVCGGLAGEVDLKFEKTHIFFEEKELTNHVSVVGFYGSSFKMESLSSTGMKPVGVDKKITKSNKNVLFEVDGKSALDWYKFYLKEKSNYAANALAYPIAIMKDSSQILGAIRTPIGFNEEEGSITFTGEIPEGYSLKLMLANPYELIEKAEDLVVNNDSEFTIYFSCAARKLFLGDLTNLEYQKAKNCMGGYVYGEISVVEGKPSLHNQTFTVVNLKEAV